MDPRTQVNQHSFNDDPHRDARLEARRAYLTVLEHIKTHYKSNITNEIFPHGVDLTREEYELITLWLFTGEELIRSLRREIV